MRVPTLHEATLFLTGFIDCVVHENLTRDVCEGTVQPACDQDTAIVQANRPGIALKLQVLRHVLFVPHILRKIVLQDQLRIVRVTEEVAAVDRAHMFIEELEGLFVGELNDIVLQSTDSFEQLVCHLRVQRDRTVLELVERRIIRLVYGD